MDVPVFPQTILVRWLGRRCAGNPGDTYPQIFTTKSTVSFPGAYIGTCEFSDVGPALFAPNATSPTNLSTLQALSDQIANDTFAWYQKSLDEVFVGVIAPLQSPIIDMLEIDYNTNKCESRIFTYPQNFSVQPLGHYLPSPDSVCMDTDLAHTSTYEPFFRYFGPPVPNETTGTTTIDVYQVSLQDGRLVSSFVQQNTYQCICCCECEGSLCVYCYEGSYSLLPGTTVTITPPGGGSPVFTGITGDSGCVTTGIVGVYNITISPPGYPTCNYTNVNLTCSYIINICCYVCASVGGVCTGDDPSGVTFTFQGVSGDGNVATCTSGSSSIKMSARDTFAWMFPKDSGVSLGLREMSEISSMCCVTIPCEMGPVKVTPSKGDCVFTPLSQIVDCNTGVDVGFCMSCPENGALKICVYCCPSPGATPYPGATVTVSGCGKTVSGTTGSDGCVYLAIVLPNSCDPASGTCTLQINPNCDTFQMYTGTFNLLTCGGQTISVTLTPATGYACSSCSTCLPIPSPFYITPEGQATLPITAGGGLVCYDGVPSTNVSVSGAMVPCWCNEPTVGEVELFGPPVDIAPGTVAVAFSLACVNNNNGTTTYTLAQSVFGAATIYPVACPPGGNTFETPVECNPLQCTNWFEPVTCASVESWIGDANNYRASITIADSCDYPSLVFLFPGDSWTCAAAPGVCPCSGIPPIPTVVLGP
jgi:hypothetical protein